MVASRQSLSHRDFLKIDKDYEAAASVADLIYVSDQEPGINRIRKGKDFIYYTYKREIIDDTKELDRIKSLVIPPAWTNVWICKSSDGHIQATGYDVSGRKQYKYHPRWSVLQQETKFHRMYEFGKILPVLRKKIEKDLMLPGFPEAKVLAMVVSLMEKTYIRVGNDGYEKLYGSYGLTTLKNKHVAIKGNKIIFAFRGKKGVYHNITLKSKKFARIIKQCKAIPGRELFQYYDESGEVKKVDSGHVNQYIKNCVEQDFTTKDFRTWAGTLMMLRILKLASPGATSRECQKTIVKAFSEVSRRLGNTVTVCKKYYVHPGLIGLYEKNNLSRFFENEISAKEQKSGLSGDEKQLMHILRSIHNKKSVIKSPKQLLRAAIKKESKKRALKVHLA
jgi:DNA topoisomerase I